MTLAESGRDRELREILLIRHYQDTVIIRLLNTIVDTTDAWIMIRKP